jgi:hypothetical protein
VEETNWKTWAWMVGKYSNYLQEVGSGGRDWIDLAQDTNRERAVVNAVKNPGLH